ncbi:MAG TPA: L-2-hydroxyglutarate oxidase [Candidatus Omnitrophota bacterium]|nr:L-2-hydroxyglutarate oxidase [Candidatus Omnitrophota bacterium]
MKQYDYIIIGAGIIGLSIARRIHHTFAQAKILIIDKEKEVAAHASSRNSGVLHAGFYYSADSLKAKLTVEGNKAMKDFCRQHHLSLNECGKLVVAKNDEELGWLQELKRRGEANGSNVRLVDAQEAEKLEPNIKTYKQALYSPDTATINPKEVCETLYRYLGERGVEIKLRTSYRGHKDSVVQTSAGDFEAKQVINCAGLYADKIAKDFGFGKNHTIIPFKGLYLKYTKNKTDVRLHIYPVPNLKNPFLGVHFTKMADGTIKIGPTAIPAFWRENYKGLSRFNLGEFLSITALEAKLFLNDTSGFKGLAQEEMKKYDRKFLIGLAQQMVKHIDPQGFTEFTEPGIRAQLFDIAQNKLVQDFIIEGDAKSIHILNAVSPAFTCAFPFASLVVQKYLRGRGHPDLSS